MITGQNYSTKAKVTRCIGNRVMDGLPCECSSLFLIQIPWPPPSTIVSSFVHSHASPLTMTMARKTYLLRPATENELRELRIQHKAEWGTGLTTEQYLVREELLASTPLTANGGIQHWVLVDPTIIPNRVLASCETIRKDVFTAPANSRRVDKESGYAIGSVFTPPEMRWNGYARILLKMMADMLMDLDGCNELSVLYSDIGKVSLDAPPASRFHPKGKKKRLNL